MSAPAIVYSTDRIVLEVQAAGDIPSGKSIVGTPTATVIRLDTGADVTSTVVIGTITVTGTNIFVPIGALTAGSTVNPLNYQLMLVCPITPADITNEQVTIPPIILRVPA